MKNFLTALFAIALTYICSLAIVVSANAPGPIIPAALAQIFVNSVLHTQLCAKGRIHLAALPASWALCVVPLYIYSFHIDRYSGFFGGGFTFQVLGFFTLLPVFAVSLLTSAVSGYRRGRAASRQDSRSGDDEH